MSSQTNFMFVNIGPPAAGFRDACGELGVAVGRMEDMEEAVPVFRKVLEKA